MWKHAGTCGEACIHINAFQYRWTTPTYKNMFKYRCVYIYIHLCLHTFTYTCQTHIQKSTCIHMYACVDRCKHIYVHMHTHRNKHIKTSLNTYIHTCIHVCINTWHAHIHAYKHTHIQLKIHICVYVQIRLFICLHVWTYLSEKHTGAQFHLQMPSIEVDISECICWKSALVCAG